MTKKCSHCDYAICEDYGYSNYTVEGTSIHCSLGLNPHGSFDRWYGEDDRDTFANFCDKHHMEFGPVDIDVDKEGLGGDRSDPNSWAAYATGKVPAEKLIEILG